MAGSPPPSRLHISQLYLVLTMSYYTENLERLVTAIAAECQLTEHEAYLVVRDTLYQDMRLSSLQNAVRRIDEAIADHSVTIANGKIQLLDPSVKLPKKKISQFLDAHGTRS